MTQTQTNAAELPEDWPFRSIFMWVDIRGCQDSNGDGIGDLPGLISRLDHFQQSGIGAMIFHGLQPSDWAYAGTMMTGFCAVDERFGTLADFDRLVAEAHRRGIAIVLGWSPFSTHREHPYFQAWRDPKHPRHAEFRDYFLQSDDVNARLPRRWGHWEWDEVRGAYYHTVWKDWQRRWCPEVNLLDPRARRENEQVMRFWLDRGADGFWVDCGVWGGFTRAEDHVAFSRELTSLVHSYRAKWVIGEGAKSIKDTIEIDGYDSFFAGQARAVPIHKTVFRRPGLGTLVEFFEGIESHGIHEALCSFYDDPGGNRILNPLDMKDDLDFGVAADVERLKLQSAIHLTLPLPPMLQFAQHCGLHRVRSPGRFQRPRHQPFLMMWEANSPHYGFSNPVPYTAQNVEGYPATVAVDQQLKDPASPLSTFQRLARLRHDCPALQCHDNVGESYARLPTDDDDNCLAYVRRHVASGQVMVVVTNLLDQSRRYALQPWRSPKVAAWLAPFHRLVRRLGPDGADLALEPRGAAQVELPPWGFAIFEAARVV